MQAAQYGIKSCDHNKDDGACPEIHAQELVEHERAGKNGDGCLGYHITDELDDGEETACLRIETPFQEFRHRIHRTPEVKGYKNPTEYQYNIRMQFIMTEHSAGLRRRACQSNDMLRTDIGSQDGSTNHKPSEVPVGQKIIRSGLFTFADTPNRNAGDDQQIDHNKYPVDQSEKLHTVGFG